VLQASSQLPIEIRPLSAEDREFLVAAMEGLMRYLLPLDPDSLLICPDDYGQMYTENLLNRVNNGSGTILVALAGTVKVGIIAGIIKSPEPHDALGTKVKRIGEVLDLYILPGFRQMGIGQRLMQALEEKFIETNCDSVGVEVFAPNQAAREFYRSLGFQDRAIWCHKQLTG
jgi:diamine N-acetyltransferase